MKAPPPMPEDCGSTRLSTICAAMPASTALPPWRNMARPASAASGWAAITMCFLALTSGFGRKPALAFRQLEGLNARRRPSRGEREQQSEEAANEWLEKLDHAGSIACFI